MARNIFKEQNPKAEGKRGSVKRRHKKVRGRQKRLSRTEQSVALAKRMRLVNAGADLSVSREISLPENNILLMQEPEAVYETKRTVKTNVSVNPYAKADGSPLKGKEDLFFNWALQKREAQLAKMTPRKKALHKAAEKALAKRMNS